MSESFVTVGADFGDADGPQLILITHSHRGHGKSWLAARMLELIHAQESAAASRPGGLIIVDELAEIDPEVWAKLERVVEAHQNGLQARRAGLVASEAIPKPLTGQEGRAREAARRAQQASRRHAQQAVTRMKAHRR